MPENWKTYKLGPLVNHQKGFAFKSKLYQTKGTQIVRVSDTTSNSIDLSSCHRIDSELALNFNQVSLKAGDVIIATVGSWLPNYSSVVGKVVKVPKEAEGALLNQNAVRLRTNDSKLIGQKFLYYLLKNNNFLYYIAFTATGSANQASITLKDIFNFEFKLPDLPEQHAIASILSALDDKIENNLAMNKTLEDMAMALYKHWFVDFGPFKDGEFVESDFGMIPKGWEVKKLDDLCEKIYSGGTPKTTVQEYWNGSIPWLSSGETRANLILETEKTITQLGLDKSSSKMAYKYDIVIASAGQGKTRGQTSLLLIDTSVNQSVLCIRANKKKIHPLTLYYDLRSRYDQFRHISDSFSTRGSLTTKLIGEQILLAVPSIEHQIGFQKQLLKNMKLQESNLLENLSLTQLRDTLLPKLISGEVRLKEFKETLANVL